MSRRHPNPGLVKTHRSYTVSEVAECLGVHRNTVREMLRRGLPTCDQKRPLLILGRDLADFLRARRAGSKRPCQPGELYCVRCRAPRTPAGNIAEYRPKTSRIGDLVGICLDCDCVIHRRASLANLDAARGSLEVLMPKGQSHIGDSSVPSSICDLSPEHETHVETQPQE